MAGCNKVNAQCSVLVQEQYSSWDFSKKVHLSIDLFATIISLVSKNKQRMNNMIGEYAKTKKGTFDFKGYYIMYVWFKFSF